MAEKISPEERLFKVIQQGKQAAGQEVKASEKQTGSWYEKLMNLMPARTLGKTSAASGKSFIAAIAWPEVDPANINKFLAVVLGVVLVFVAAEALGKRKDVTVIRETLAKLGTLPEEGKKAETLKELSFYLGEVQKRDLFHAGVAVSTAEAVPMRIETLEKAAGDMKLQGISWGDVPKAMILWQDGKDSKMYFLVEGQAIGTSGFKVIQILKSTVKIGNGKEEAVLL